MRYYSEREIGELPRESGEIGPNIWRGILAVIGVCVADGSFGARYPNICEDGTFVSGANMEMLEDAVRADIPNLAVIADQNRSRYRHSFFETLGDPDNQPSTLDILDLIQFCWNSVGKPTKISHHSYFVHSHLTFDEEAGREDFRNHIETIFRRNQIAYVLTEDGRVERLVPPIFEGILAEPEFKTGDTELNRLMGMANRKFLNPYIETRREALEALWDAWERLKTLDGGHKKAQIKAMLDRTAGISSPRFREAVEQEAKELTDIGNSLRIRHSETNQEILETSEHMDYLFYRLYSLIHLILQSR